MNEVSLGSDPASLSRLHDIITPPPISWWPLAPGWGVVGIALLVLLLWLMWCYVTWLRRNAYRREALRLLKALPVHSSSLPQLDELLKRVALSAYPREQVASLSGIAWLKFLDGTMHGKTVHGGSFVGGSARVLAEAAYQREEFQGDIRAVLTAAENWIRHHEGHHSC